jgi:hypothetical protein
MIENPELERAKREIRAVEDALRAGHSPYSDNNHTTRTAIRVAAEALGENRQAFRERVGTPLNPGRYKAKFGLEPKWSLYKKEERPYIIPAPIKPEDILVQQNKVLKDELAAIRRENNTAESIRSKIFGLAEYAPDPPEWTLREKGSSGHKGIPVTIWSDWHWGESVRADQVGNINEFDRKIALRRAKSLVESTIDIAKNHMGNSNKKGYPGIIICLGGDMMTGDIHEDLRENSWATPQQCINELTDILAACIDNMAVEFGNVYIPAVVGNHGRGTLKPRANNVVYTSHEWNIYSNLERYFKSTKKIRFYISPNIDAHFKSFGHKYLLTHGDRLGTTTKDAMIGCIGQVVRGSIKIGQAERYIGRDFDTLLVCHNHVKMEPPGIIGNGCLIGYSSYAHNILRATPERPSQTLWFSHPKHGITATWAVYLEDKLREDQEKEWVSWKE